MGTEIIIRTLSSHRPVLSVDLKDGGIGVMAEVIPSIKLRRLVLLYEPYPKLGGHYHLPKRTTRLLRRL